MAESALTLRDFLLARPEDARQAIERSDAGAKLKEAVGKLPGGIDLGDGIEIPAP